MQLDSFKKRGVLNSPHLSEIKRKKRNVLKSRVFFIFLGIIFLFVVLIFVSRLDSLNIKNIEISGNKIIETKILEDTIRQEISGYYFWVIPKSNFLFYPQNKIKNALTQTLKRIQDISINLKNSQTLEITLKERSIEYTYCGATVSSESKCYFLDQNGYIFDEAPYFSGTVYFKFFGKTSTNTENPIGSNFLPNKFADVTDFVSEVQKIKLRPSALLSKDDSDLELYLGESADIANSPKITFKSNVNFKKLPTILETAISAEPLAGNLKKKFDDLIYIDLRFGNKVYYKFKSQTTIAPKP